MTKTALCVCGFKQLTVQGFLEDLFCSILCVDELVCYTRLGIASGLRQTEEQ